MHKFDLRAFWSIWLKEKWESNFYNIFYLNCQQIFKFIFQCFENMVSKIRFLQNEMKFNLGENASKNKKVLNGTFMDVMQQVVMAKIEVNSTSTLRHFWLIRMKLHRTQIHEFLNENWFPSGKPAVKSLMEEIKHVNRAKYEFDFPEMAVLIALFRTFNLSVS